MASAGLREIVAAWGGVAGVAAVPHVRPRTEYHWLDGKRKIRPMAAELIRLLQTRQ